MMKGNLCTTYAENYRNAGENALKQHILTPVFAELNVVISLPLLVLHESIENEDQIQNILNININRSCSNHMMHFQVCFKKAFQRHSKTSELCSHRSWRLYCCKEYWVRKRQRLQTLMPRLAYKLLKR